MVSRARAFTVATAWILAGLAAGVVAFTASTGGLGDQFRDTVISSLLWSTIFLPGCLVVAGLWVYVGSRNARSAASLGGQAALFGLAAALVALLLLAVIEQSLGTPAA
ncbi:hypothetical protein [Paractinoplanes durhamensis]|uniref:Uncharacterized protein n=1 Tax=Paractinoplanes durhamensis TaxID=113563 RepID=A0ABQ3YTC8_9ACTN|nr:hypothetical protein [Actinoplanes durhamensis]GIE00744.1 hypothetical protein Adu01nite_20940 [Actinoplanes durhamensis]